MQKRRRTALGALACASCALALVLLAREFFPGLVADADSGEAFAAGYFAIVVLVPLITMFTLASVVLATVAAMRREKLFTLLTLVLIAATWTWFSPYTVQALIGEIAAQPSERGMTLLLLAVSAIIYLTPLLFLLARPARRRG